MTKHLKIEGGPAAEHLATSRDYKFSIDGTDVGGMISRVDLVFAPNEIAMAHVEIGIGHVLLGSGMVEVRVKQQQIDELNAALQIFGYEIVKKADGETA